MPDRDPVALRTCAWHSAAVPLPAAVGEPAEHPHSELTTTVTLVTGDRIEVVAGQIRPVRGGDGIGSVEQTVIRAYDLR